MASPPEVHSALLSAGPGAGPLLAAAAAWSSLSAEYTAVAEELTAVLATVEAGAWQGPAADSYLGAHAPYLAWLSHAAADSAAAAAQCQTAAAAYNAALAAMPTLPELAANHAVHGVLVATNFFGINTIPIAVNEADYLRMWVQAATTMSTYQAVAGSAVAAAPHTAVAPQIQRAAASSEQPQWQNPLQGLLDVLEPILKSLGIQDGVTAHDPMISNAFTTAVSHFLQNLGIHWDPAAGTLNGYAYDYYSNAAQPIWYLARTLELFEDFTYMAQDPTRIIPALQYLAALALFDWPTHIAQLATAISQSPAMVAAAAGAVVAPVGSLGGLAGLAGLGAPASPVGVPATPLSPVITVEATVVGPAVPVAPPPPAPPPPAPATAGAAPAAAAPPPPAPAPASSFAFPYLIGGGPGIDFGSGLGARTGAAAGAKKKTPTPEAAAAVAVADSRRAARRRRRKTRAGHEDAAMAPTVGVEPEWGPDAVSDHGAGELGRAGAVRDDAACAAGLARLGGAEFAEGPRLPLLPESWRSG